MNLKRETETAIKLAKEAAAAILNVYEGNIAVEYKDDKSPLTVADKRANDIIEAGLIKEFPEYAILSEEGANDEKRLQNDWCWVVDPLDGTKEFIKRNGEFTVNIALTYKKKSVLGVVLVPVSGDYYFAYSGSGAYLVKDGIKKKISVSDKQSDLTMTMSRSHAGERETKLIEENDITNIIQIGSSLKGCLVAEGRADIYYRFGYTMEWDTAAMQCVIEEAGGIFRQMDDDDMHYNRENNLNDKGFYILNRIENKMDISK